MNCQDLSRVLESRDVNALTADERHACERHAASCPHCEPDWVVFTRLAAMPAPPMPQQLTVRCEALAVARLAGNERRLPGWVVSVGAIVVVAAAAMLIARLMSAPPKIGVQGSIPAAIVPSGTPAAIGAAPGAPAQGLAAREPSDRTVTVTLQLDQATDDATGQNFGQRVYERAREELRMLPGVVLLDADSAGAAMPAFRITFTNLSKSGGSFYLGSDGLVAFPVKGDEQLLVNALLYLKVEALPPGAADASVYRTGITAFVPVECIGLRKDRCPQARTGNYLAPSDCATYFILSWYLQRTPPDPRLVDRLREMLRDSSTPAPLWQMALASLSKYRKLRLDASGLLAAANRVVSADPALAAELARSALSGASRSDLAAQMQDLLLRELPDGSRPTDSALRKELVLLLATDLKNEPAARGILESVAANDPDFEVRAAAKRALGTEVPSTSFIGPTDEP